MRFPQEFRVDPNKGLCLFNVTDGNFFDAEWVTINSMCSAYPAYVLKSPLIYVVCSLTLGALETTHEAM